VRRVESEAKLMRDGGDGTSVYEHLVAARRRGMVAPELDLPPVPDEGRYIVAAFSALSGQRQVGMSGPQRITLEAMQAYAQIHQRPFTPWELETLCAMDAALLRTLAEGRN